MNLLNRLVSCAFDLTQGTVALLPYGIWVQSVDLTLQLSKLDCTCHNRHYQRGDRT